MNWQVGINITVIVLFVVWSAWQSWSIISGLFSWSKSRGADDAAPQGVSEYLLDLQSAAEGATAEFILEHAKNGSTISQIQAARINQLMKGAK